MPFIKAIDYYLPKTILSNEKLVEEFPEWTVEKIASKVGVNNRHIAATDETAVDLACKAAENLFNHNPNIHKEDIDFLIFCTQSPDYFLPTSACIIQEKLKLSTNLGSFDFNLGCSGYIYGLALAKSLIVSNIASTVLLLTGETYSKFLHPKDKGNRTIFGDAATATLISNSGWGEILNFSFGTDGRGTENLIVKTGGMRLKEKLNDLEFDDNGNPLSSDYLYMNGTNIFTFTQKNVPLVVKDNIQKNNLSLEDIDLFILHQANTYMLEFLRKKMKIEPNRFFINMAEIGNTVSNSIPIALYDAKDKGKIKGNILLCGFGVGYSWGATVIKVIK